MGSSRPAARNLKNLGIACLVADGINGLFYRNCVNFAFPATECPGVEHLFEEGDTAEVDFSESLIRNATRGKSLPMRQIPQQLLKIIDAGGIFSLLEKEGAIAPKSS
jgi:3-isopropylmalate/(R)-2-methylmalate dehydratase small subunit